MRQGTPSVTERMESELIARVAFFDRLSPDIAAASEDNLHRRFLPALAGQPGFVSGLWCKDADGNALSVSVWESAEALREGGAHANATPLLPGQREDQIASPDRVRLYEVTAFPGPVRA